MTGLIQVKGFSARGAPGPVTTATRIDISDFDRRVGLHYRFWHRLLPATARPVRRTRKRLSRFAAQGGLSPKKEEYRYGDKRC